MNKETIIRLLSLFGIILALSLFFLDNRLDKVITTVVDRLFVISLFTADHNLIMELKNQGLIPSLGLLQISYQSYFSTSYGRDPSRQELQKIQTLQDYLSGVGTNHNEIVLQSNKITENFLAEKRNIEVWELILTATLISTQIVNIFLINSRKQISWDGLV